MAERPDTATPRVKLKLKGGRRSTDASLADRPATSDASRGPPTDVEMMQTRKGRKEGSSTSFSLYGASAGAIGRRSQTQSTYANLKDEHGAHTEIEVDVDGFMEMEGEPAGISEQETPQSGGQHSLLKRVALYVTIGVLAFCAIFAYTTVADTAPHSSPDIDSLPPLSLSVQRPHPPSQPPSLTEPRCPPSSSPSFALLLLRRPPSLPHASSPSPPSPQPPSPSPPAYCPAAFTCGAAVASAAVASSHTCAATTSSCPSACCSCAEACVDPAWPSMLPQWVMAQAGFGIRAIATAASNASILDWMGGRRKMGMYHAIKRGNQHDTCSASFHGVMLTYVQNYKVNTQGICANLMKINDHSRLKRGQVAFTFVREPLGRFSSVRTVAIGS